ncbi:MAG TPA: carboxypeptidase regulatory-like domain-containing protein [Polyangia bacterium]|nr:carboxypeptidase regulatory-like domain-containing protein [Polyangia bacterium]
MTSSFAASFRPMLTLLLATVGCAGVAGRVGGDAGASASGGRAGTAGSTGANGGAMGDASVVDGSPAGPGPSTSNPGSCVNLQCQQVSCPGGATTSISGTAFAPDGKLPLYDVTVYVPNAPLPPFKSGVTCDRCGGGEPVRALASAISDAKGTFRLTNVPAGKNIPVVFQVGKWRRKITLDTVTACQDNPITDANLSRLPRNQTEGDMPRIAVTTGGCDFLGCLFPQVGVDLSELGTAGQNRAVTFYKGATDPDTASQPPIDASDATTLWTDGNELAKYDMLILSCECSEWVDNKGPKAYAAMTDYLAKGGRIFGTDYSYVWYRYMTDPKMRAAVTLQAPHPNGDFLGDSPMLIDTTFPKGKALADWMGKVAIDAESVYDNVMSVMPPSAQVWATSAGNSGASGPRIFSVNTPVGVPGDQQCGRAVHIDAHIKPLSIQIPSGAPVSFSMLCGDQLSPGEAALAFLLFDLAACVQDDSRPVIPPIVIP